MSSSETVRFTFDGNAVTSAVFVEGSEISPFVLEEGGELLRLGAGVVHFEMQDDGGWEWTLYLPGEGADWFERADGRGRITAEQVDAFALFGDDEDDDMDGDEEGDGLVGGSRYRFIFGEDGSIASVYEVEDGRLEEESISPDESYFVFDGFVVKTEDDDGALQWEIYALAGSGEDWIEVASGRGSSAPVTLDAIEAAIEAEDGIAEDIDGDDDDRFEGGDDDDEFLGDDGDDDYIGGGGRDCIRFGGEDGVRVDLRVKTHQDTGRGYDRIEDVEDLGGSLGEDVLIGNFLPNSLRGNDGDDIENGNGGNDNLWGDRGNDSLMGGGGIDSLNGGLGNDDIKGATGDDKIVGNAGDDLLKGNDGRDNLVGGDGADDLWGGGGNDVLRGGNGADDLYGGAGRDVFVFKTVSEGGLGSFDDMLFNFKRGEDKVDLRDFDLSFVGRDRFSGEGSGELRFERFSEGVRAIADVDGDARADFSMEIRDVTACDVVDFML